MKILAKTEETEISRINFLENIPARTPQKPAKAVNPAFMINDKSMSGILNQQAKPNRRNRPANPGTFPFRKYAQ
jgi:hypothetical protein